jgi:hypothetical protein
MRAIINGKRYDTDTATLIGEAGSHGSVSVNDFHYWEAGLYVTPRSGLYFIAGEGGPLTRFSRSTGQNSWSGGERIIPLSKDEALAWAEQNLTFKEVEEHFGDVIEDA